VKLLVTGSTGFLGANLIHHLVKRGDEVRALKRKQTPPTLLEGLPVEIAEGDVTDFDSLLRATEGVEGVYHVAGLVSYWRPKREQMFRVNVDGARNVVKAALHNGVRRVVHTSSIAAIGFREDGQPSDEETPWNWGPYDVGYPASKYQGQQVAVKAIDEGLEVVVVNPALIFGPRDIGWNAGRMLKMVQQESTIRIPAGATTTCDVDDVCAGHIAAMERGQSGRRYILGGERANYADLFKLIGEVMGRRVKVQAVPFWVASLAAYGSYGVSLLTRKEPDITPELMRVAQRSRQYSSERAIRELGYPQTPLRQTLEKTYRWYRENGYLK
jgi:dihydroflavonol-4-reductase